jgi:2-polyprenyl-3-methyl-5-hydroxy-6-metoxy-1,4-benzoquinol methylase
MSDLKYCKCPICGEDVRNVLTSELRRGHGRVLHCTDCDHGFLQLEHQVDAKNFYSEQYRQEYSHNAEKKATNARELFDVYKNYQKDRLATIEALIRPDTKVLEVGASAGQFLWHIKDRVQVVNAIELDTECRNFLESELHISADDEYLEHSRFAAEKYDVVCAFQVMEHVENPFDFMKSLRAATSIGGTILVEVPNFHDPLLSVWNVPCYGRFYYHSAHVHYFSETSLRKAALLAGFQEEQIEISFTQDYNLLNHLHWIMNNGPQADCYVGLSEIAFASRDIELGKWLTQELRTLNQRYVERLIGTKHTSNMMMKIVNA